VPADRGIAGYPVLLILMLKHYVYFEILELGRSERFMIEGPHFLVEAPQNRSKPMLLGLI